MAAGIYVFLGPSLSVAEGKEVLDAEFLPPVKMGDVQSLLGRHPRIICIIDGYFERVPAVWHKEILYALSRGVRVVGASSMGALRAAELSAFGMEGVGSVFEAFREGQLTSDDEVALVHASAEDGFRTVSEALVNIRDGLALAETRGILDTRERAALVDASRALFYPDRSWARVLRDAEVIGIEAPRLGKLRALFLGEKPNVKRRDALAALSYVAKTVERAPAPASFDFEPTEFWHRLVGTITRAPAGAAGDGPLAASVLDYAKIVEDDYRALRDRALLAILATTEAGRIGIRVTPEQCAAAAERIRLKCGLASAEKTRAWLVENALSAEDFTDICRLDVLCDELASRHGRLLDEAITAELKRRGTYGAYARAVGERERALVAAAQVNPSMTEVGIDTQGLVAWYKDHCRPLHGSLEAHAKSRGFGDAAAFLRELVKLYRAAQKAQSDA